MPDPIYSTAENFWQPVLQYNAKSKLWRLAEDYTFEWGLAGFRKRLYMRAGFEYDKASVPRLLWVIARPDGPWEAASLFHDRLYRDRGFFNTPEEFRFETCINGLWLTDSSRWHRPDADNLLEYMGKIGGADSWQPSTYRCAVKLNPINWLFKNF